MTMPIIFCDTETTSLSAEDGEIWEFAGIRREPDGTETQLEFQIECDLGKADPASLNIGRYYERFGLKGYWDPSIDDKGNFIRLPEGEVVSSKFDAAKLISDFTRGATLIGNVISFDSERMERLLRGWNQCPGWHYHVIDLEPVIAGYALARGVPFDLPYKSSELSKWVGVEPPKEGKGLHTALGDALWVKEMWDAIHHP